MKFLLPRLKKKKSALNKQLPENSLFLIHETFATTVFFFQENLHPTISCWFTQPQRPKRKKKG